ETEASGWSHEKVPTTAANNANASLSHAENEARARANFVGWRELSADYRNVFPGVHFVYNLGPIQARASYNVSITRPSAGNYAGNITVNDTTMALTSPNPNVKPYTSDNFEAGLRYYFEPVGELSATVFLKEIKNYFANVSTIIGSGPDNGFNGEYAGYTWNM